MSGERIRYIGGALDSLGVKRAYASGRRFLGLALRVAPLAVRLAPGPEEPIARLITPRPMAGLGSCFPEALAPALVAPDVRGIPRASRCSASTSSEVSSRA